MHDPVNDLYRHLAEEERREAQRGLDLSVARRAMGFYPLAMPRQRRVQAVRYARAVAILGDRWLLVKRAERLPKPRPV